MVNWSLGFGPAIGLVGYTLLPDYGHEAARRPPEEGNCVSAPTLPSTRRLALLIDGDNAQPSLIDKVLAEVAKYGTGTTRRIYGDWTEANMRGWKETLQEFAIQPIQQFRFTVGKNATDSAWIIEAIDLLHSGIVEGFCVVSSDSDYTRLATRIRESGLFVMGIGRSNTPRAFVAACEVFVYTENLSEDAKAAPIPATSLAKTKGIATDAPPPALMRAVEMAAQEDGWASLGAVGNFVQQLDSGFDPRTYGFKQLSLLIGSFPDKFEVRKTGKRGGQSAIYVRTK